MITIVVPTLNRAHTIRKVGESLFAQDQVTEIVFVNDGGTDDTEAVVEALAARYPAVSARVLRNARRMGASFARIRGYEAASNDYVLFCDDDVFLMPGYAATCLTKLRATRAAIVSGRRVTKRPDETVHGALARFGRGSFDGAPFRYLFCEFREEARFDGDIELPITHNAILTTRALLQRLSYDAYYSRGNGYREESDFQMHSFVTGGVTLVTNDAHCVELSRWESRTGGQRTNRFNQWYWSVVYTGYFYRKYYARYARRVGLRAPRMAAVSLFALYQLYMLFIRPLRRLGALRVLRPMTIRAAAGR